MKEQCFWLRVKGLISLPELQSILNKNLFEKFILFTGVCFISLNNTKLNITSGEVLELSFEYAVLQYRLDRRK
jgi:hypothetical protein